MIKELARKFASVGVRRALHLLRWELRAMRLHQRGLRKAAALAGKTGLRIHLGCGENLKPGFINIDIHDRADLTLDLREPLPFADKSCALIYSEHFLEHVSYPETALAVLRESFRVLQPGGVFSAGVPDTEWPLLEYARVRQEGYFELAKQRWHPQWCVTEMEQINFHFRQGEEHRFAYDYKTLEHVLRQAGFANVRRRAFRADLDSAKWEGSGTLYVEAIKSGVLPPNP